VTDIAHRVSLAAEEISDADVAAVARQLDERRASSLEGRRAYAARTATRRPLS